MNKMIFPILLMTLLAACGKKEEAAAPAAPTTAPTATTPAAPAPAPAGAAPAATSAAAAPAAGGDLAKGEHVYKATCAMCHATGAGGAPVFGNKGDWEPRIAQGKETLYGHAIKGFTGTKGVMPPKGANTSLSDEDVKAAVDYMASQIK